MRYLKIPKERVAVLIGPEGKTKRYIEKRTSARIDVNSKEGEVNISPAGDGGPLQSMQAADVVKAIARGFSPERAYRLFDDSIYLEIMDIRDYTGKSQKHIVRMRARLIGTKGKTRRILEDLSGCKISIYGNTVGIIGDIMEMGIAKTAVDMLLSGSEHATVYRFLERKQRKLKMRW